MTKAVYHNPDLDFHCSAIIPHPDGQRVLMLSDGDRSLLPYFVPYEHHFGVVGHICRYYSEQLGADLTVQRCLHDAYDAENKKVDRIYLLENQGPDLSPPREGQWIQHLDLANLSLANPSHGPVLEGWFAEVESRQTPALRKAWATAGWFKATSSWMRDEASRQGLHPSGTVEQLRCWERSSILRMPTESGFVYLKAIPPGITHEMSLTQVLARHYPGQLPRVIAADPERRFLLMDDIGGAPLSTVNDIRMWENALRRYAQMQVDYSLRTADLLALGCPDFRLQSLLASAEALLADSSVMLPGQQEGLSEEEVKRAQATVPGLRSLCEQLATYAVPHSLTHGDLWSQNIVWADDRPVYFDWSDSSVSHPFIDVALFLETGEVFSDTPDAKGILRNAYLESWSRFERPERLTKVFAFARPLACLYKAVFHHQFLLPMMEDGARWELASAIPGYLRALLDEPAWGDCATLIGA